MVGVVQVHPTRAQRRPHVSTEVTQLWEEVQASARAPRQWRPTDLAGVGGLFLICTVEADTAADDSEETLPVYHQSGVGASWGAQSSFRNMVFGPP